MASEDDALARTGIDILIRCLVSGGILFPGTLLGVVEKELLGGILGSLLACRQ